MKTQINLPFRILRNYYSVFKECTGNMPDFEIKENIRQATRDELQTVKNILCNGLWIDYKGHKVENVQLVDTEKGLMFKSENGKLYRYSNAVNHMQDQLKN